MVPGNCKIGLLAIRSLMFVALCAMLFSFSVGTGGDTFEISLNGKLVFQQNLWRDKDVKSIPLDPSLSNDALSVRYSHCGKVGTARRIVIRDEKDKVLKEWHFPDAAAGASPAMTCMVKEILAFKKKGPNQKVDLFYSANELPDGRVLATFVLKDENKVTMK